MSNWLKNFIGKTALAVALGPSFLSANNSGQQLGTPGFINNPTLLNGNTPDTATALAWGVASLIDPKGEISRRLGVNLQSNRNQNTQDSQPLPGEMDSAVIHFSNQALMQQQLNNIATQPGNKLITYLDITAGEKIRPYIWQVQNGQFVYKDDIRTITKSPMEMAGLLTSPTDPALRADVMQLRSTNSAAIYNFNALVQGDRRLPLDQANIITDLGIATPNLNPNSAPLQNTTQTTPTQNQENGANGYITSPIGIEFYLQKKNNDINNPIVATQNAIEDAINRNFNTLQFATWDSQNNAVIWQAINGKGMTAKIQGKEVTLSARNFIDMLQQGNVPGAEPAIEMKKELSYYVSNPEGKASLDKLVIGLQDIFKGQDKSPTVTVSAFTGKRPGSPALPDQPVNPAPDSNVRGGDTAPATTNAENQDQEKLKAAVDRLYHISLKWGHQHNVEWHAMKGNEQLKSFPSTIAKLLTDHVNAKQGSGELGRYLDNNGKGTNEEQFKNNPNPVNPFNNGDLRKLLTEKLSQPGTNLTAITQALDSISTRTTPNIAGAPRQDGTTVPLKTDADNKNTGVGGRKAQTHDAAIPPVQSKPAAPAINPGKLLDGLVQHSSALIDATAKSQGSESLGVRNRRLEQLMTGIDKLELPTDTLNVRDAIQNFRQAANNQFAPDATKRSKEDNATIKTKYEEEKLLLQSNLRDLVHRNPDKAKALDELFMKTANSINQDIGVKPNMKSAQAMIDKAYSGQEVALQLTPAY